MRWRIVGIVLLLVSIILLGTMVFSYPTGDESHPLLNEQVPVLYVYEATEFGAPIVAEKNVTINPSAIVRAHANSEYRVNVVVNATKANVTGNVPALIDFWVVNHTGRNLIWSYLENETYFQFLPNASYVLPGVKAYAHSIESAIIAKTLRGMDYDGNYTLLLINPDQNTTAALTSILVEDLLITRGYLVNADAITISMTAISAVAGIFLIIKPPGKSSRHARRSESK